VVHVAAQLALHGRRRTPKRPGDLSNRIAALNAGEDVLSLSQAQVAAFGLDV
jgi:hypothetical protein